MSAYDVYEFDHTGALPANKVTNELHTVTPPTDPLKHYFIVPKHAPFFHENVKVVRKGTTDVTLALGADYVFGFEYKEASHATADSIYGCIILTNRDVAGVVEIEYQTVGGDYAISSEAALNTIAATITNPRTSTWDTVVNPPIRFPAIDHLFNTTDLIGMSDTVNKMGEIATAIETGGASDPNNPGSSSGTTTQIVIDAFDGYAARLRTIKTNMIAAASNTP